MEDWDADAKNKQHQARLQWLPRHVQLTMPSKSCRSELQIGADPNARSELAADQRRPLKALTASTAPNVPWKRIEMR